MRDKYVFATLSQILPEKPEKRDETVNCKGARVRASSKKREKTLFFDPAVTVAQVLGRNAAVVLDEPAQIGGVADPAAVRDLLDGQLRGVQQFDDPADAALDAVIPRQDAEAREEAAPRIIPADSRVVAHLLDGVGPGVVVVDE